MMAQTGSSPKTINSAIQRAKATIAWSGSEAKSLKKLSFIAIKSFPAIAEHIHHRDQAVQQGGGLPEDHLAQEQYRDGQSAVQSHFDAIGGASLINLGGLLEPGGDVLAAFLDEPQKERREGVTLTEPLSRFALAGHGELMPLGQALGGRSVGFERLRQCQGLCERSAILEHKSHCRGEISETGFTESRQPPPQSRAPTRKENGSQSEQRYQAEHSRRHPHVRQCEGRARNCRLIVKLERKVAERQRHE